MSRKKEKPKPKKDEIEKLAQAIAADLFSSPTGFADRLVLEISGRDSGGWEFKPMAARIETILRARGVKT